MAREDSPMGIIMPMVTSELLIRYGVISIRLTLDPQIRPSSGTALQNAW